MTLVPDRLRAIRLAHATKENMRKGSQPIPWSTEEQVLMSKLLLEALSEDPHDAAPKTIEISTMGEERAREFIASVSSPPMLFTDPLEHLNYLIALHRTDFTNIVSAEQSYQASWKRRGGVGAFMMMCRKWDRLEPRVAKHGYDIFAAVRDDKRREGAIDDVRDLRRYLALVECECIRLGYVEQEGPTKDTES